MPDRSRRRAPSTASAGSCPPSPRARRCRSARPTSATSGRTIEGVLDKVHEELAELRAAATPAEQAEEYGDLLFVLVNVARWQGIEAEAALRAANDKFRRRFASVERQAAERGVALRDLDFAELDALWDAAKVEEKAAVAAAAKETAR